MRVKQQLRHLISAAALSALLLSACGSGRDLAADLGAGLSAGLDTDATLPGSVGSSANDELVAAIPKILQGIEDIKQEIKALEIRGTATGPTTTSKPGTKPSTSKPGTSTKPSTSTSKPTAKPVAEPADEPSAKDKGAIELKAIMNKIRTAPLVALTAEKHEKNLDTGKVTFNKIKMWSKQPNVVKIEIIKSSTGSDGVQALYTSGVGNTIKIKKLFIKLDLPKTDDRVVSNNGYTADVIDLFGVSSRMSNGYEAELVGTTQLSGKTINILKVTTSGTNTLDDRISHEYLGYDPETYAIRLWECYDKSGGKDPYYRMTLTEMAYPASLPNSTFNL
ncbi:MAG: hypothetical protein CVV27_08685 [Candidatus Melainabacteria bacterium HGW-Melainabacteria-1]|nr:MAG: hypothetical protein CVV27_08685 [Candidatus Melainabacteria bacterium HGW-Melainabacteria-1]